MGKGREHDVGEKTGGGEQNLFNKFIFHNVLSLILFNFVWLGCNVFFFA